MWLARGRPDTQERRRRGLSFLSQFRPKLSGKVFLSALSYFGWLALGGHLRLLLLSSLVTWQPSKREPDFLLSCLWGVSLPLSVSCRRLDVKPPSRPVANWRQLGTGRGTTNGRKGRAWRIQSLSTTVEELKRAEIEKKLTWISACMAVLP